MTAPLNSSTLATMAARFSNVLLLAVSLFSILMKNNIVSCKVVEDHFLNVQNQDRRQQKNAGDIIYDSLRLSNTAGTTRNKHDAFSSVYVRSTKKNDHERELLAVTNNNDPELIQRCFVRFAGLQFSLRAFDRFDTFFRDDSVMVLAQAGIYQGSENIEEYVKFGDPVYSPYIQVPDIAPPNFSSSPAFRSLDETNSLCEFTIVQRRDYILDPETTAYASEVTLALMARITFDYMNEYIRSIYIYYNPGWLNFVFGALLNSKQTRRFVCDEVLNGSCNYNVKNCEQTMRKLDTFNDGGYFDGDSEACRDLHAAFAWTNPINHCPHVSLEPMEDPNGNIKCFESDLIQVSDLFEDADITLFTDIEQTFGIDPQIGYLESCDEKCAKEKNKSKR